MDWSNAMMVPCASWGLSQVAIQAVAMSMEGEQNAHLTCLICVQMLRAVQMARITVAHSLCQSAVRLMVDFAHVVGRSVCV